MTFDWIRTRAMTRRHGWGFLRDDGRLDMHWHVLSESLGSHSDDAFWDAAVPFETEGFTARTLAPADLLLHLLVHGTSGMNAPVVQWIADAVHVVRTYGADTITERFVRQARAHGELAKVSAAFGAISDLVGPREVATIASRVARNASRRSSGCAGRAPRARSSRNVPPAATAWPAAPSSSSPIASISGSSTSPALSVAYAASGRAPAVARLGRRLTGSLAHPAVDGRVP